MKKTLFKYASIVVCIVFVLNLLAYMFYWYAAIPWYDMLMHTIGGLFLAIALAGVFLRYVQTHTAFSVLIFLLFGVIVVGLGWEVFEYIVQGLIKGVHLADIPDSISDLICDTVGGLIGTCFVLILRTRYTSHNDN